jgi:2-oxoisovalerate dehydrogenase E1 component
MLHTRICDEKIIVLYKQNRCHFQIGAAGHEACQIAAALASHRGKDWYYPYYRDMGLCSALGMTSRDFMANALNLEVDPNSAGRQMPMHYGSCELNIVSQSSPTGTQFLQAVGCALAGRIRGTDEVVYVSAGEGTCSQGDFHEALNWASRDKLPVVFLIQNNDYAISVHVSDQLAGASVYKLCAGYEGLHAAEIDGTNFIESYEALTHAYARARSGEGPALIEAHVPRLQSHSISDNQLKYRTSEQIAGEFNRDPLPQLARVLMEQRIATEEELALWRTEIQQEVDAAALWAENHTRPDPQHARTHTIDEHDPVLTVAETPRTGESIYLVDALNHALDEELSRNREMIIFGQDVAYGKGGVFTVTAGLTEKHSDSRVFNAPLAESSIVGVAIGLATRGIRPVVEIQFGDYIWTAMMQIRNELAMMRYRSAGSWTCPMVIRVPVGGYIHGALYHSQNIEATFSHFPGLFVVYPSNASDAKALLKSAIRSTNPVLFLEHKGLYRQVYAKGPEGGKEDLAPLGKARIISEGTDVTLITWGALVQRSLVATQKFTAEGYTIEIIDLRTIVPFDRETVLASVMKTGRVLIVHEDVTFMGFGAEIAAQISELAFAALDAPVIRVGMPSVAGVPHAPELEQVILPQQHDIEEAIQHLLEY